MKAKPIQIDALAKQLQTQYKAALLYGPDFSVVTDCANQIKNIITPNPTEFSLIKVSKNQLKETPSFLIDEANTISLLADKKIIWLKEADNTHTEAVEIYIDNVKTDTFLLLTADNLLKSSSLRNYCENHPEVLAIACYEDSEKDIRLLINTTLKSNGYTFSETVLDVLCARLNENRLTTKNELDKLITYLGETTIITTKDVEAVIPDIKNTTIDNLCFAVALGKQTEADKSTQILLDNGEAPASIIRLLMMHFNKLLLATDMYSRKEPMENITKKLLRSNQYMLKEAFISQICLWQKSFVIKTLQLLSETEEQTRNNNLPPEIILQRTITMVSGLARKLKKR